MVVVRIPLAGATVWLRITPRAADGMHYLLRFVRAFTHVFVYFTFLPCLSLPSSLPPPHAHTPPSAPIDFEALIKKELPAPWTPPLEVDQNFEAYEEDDRVEPYMDDGTGWDAGF